MQDLAAARRTPWGGAGFELFDSKLHPPVVRAAIVPRPALVDRLIAMPEGSVVSIVAPAGYGKSTLLAQWAERSRGADRLVVARRARQRSGDAPRVHRGRARPRRTGGSGDLPAPKSGEPLDRADRGVATRTRDVVDATGHARPRSRRSTAATRECRDVVAELAVNLPAGAKLAIASRETPPVPRSRLREPRRDHRARRR